MKNLLIPTIALGFATMGGANAATIIDDFNSYSGNANTNALWQARYTNTATSIQFDSGTGLKTPGPGASTALNVTADQTFVRKDTGFDLSAGAVTATIFFQFAGATSTSSPQIGFTLIPNGNFTGIGDLSGRLTTGNLLQLRQNNGTALTAGSALTLTTGSWYQISYSLTRTTTANTFSASVSLFNATDAGSVGSQVGSTLSSSIVDAVFYADTDVYFALRENTTISAMDNLKVTQVPEPSPTLVLLGGVGMLVLLRRRN